MIETRFDISLRKVLHVFNVFNIFINFIYIIPLYNFIHQFTQVYCHASNYSSHLRQLYRRFNRHLLYLFTLNGSVKNYLFFIVLNPLNLDLLGKRLIFRCGRKNSRLLFSSRSTLTIHI